MTIRDEIKEILLKHIGLDEPTYFVEAQVDELENLVNKQVQKEREEAKAEARMELEVEVGLQKFGQLIKEKEKIKEEAVREFVKYLWFIDSGTWDTEAIKSEAETYLQAKGGKE